jgi:hypothetical protein
MVKSYASKNMVVGMDPAYQAKAYADGDGERWAMRNQAASVLRTKIDNSPFLNNLGMRANDVDSDREWIPRNSATRYFMDEYGLTYDPFEEVPGFIRAFANDDRPVGPNLTTSDFVDALFLDGEQAYNINKVLNDLERIWGSHNARTAFVTDYPSEPGSIRRFFSNIEDYLNETVPAFDEESGRLRGQAIADETLMGLNIDPAIFEPQKSGPIGLGRARKIKSKRDQLRRLREAEASRKRTSPR